jgi:prepilin-type N-terminal cleavage/methylation domain-containing protein
MKLLATKKVFSLNRETRDAKLETGFTLLEIVVAMAIVAIGVVTVLQIFSVGLRLATASSARTDAVAYSRQAVDAFLARQIFAPRGDSGSIGRTFSWQIDVDPVRDDSQDAPPNWQISEVTLRLRYPQAERDKILEMKTLRLFKQKSQ